MHTHTHTHIRARDRFIKRGKVKISNREQASERASEPTIIKTTKEHNMHADVVVVVFYLVGLQCKPCTTLCACVYKSELESM